MLNKRLTFLWSPVAWLYLLVSLLFRPSSSCILFEKFNFSSIHSAFCCAKMVSTEFFSLLTDSLTRRSSDSARLSWLRSWLFSLMASCSPPTALLSSVSNWWSCDFKDEFWARSTSSWSSIDCCWSNLALEKSKSLYNNKFTLVFRYAIHGKIAKGTEIARLPEWNCLLFGSFPELFYHSDSLIHLFA